MGSLSVHVLHSKRLMLFTVWIPPIILGALLAKNFNILYLTLITVGLFLSMFFQHELHSFLGFSSTTYGGSLYRGGMFLIGVGAITVYLTFTGLWFTAGWVVLGFLSMLLYWRTHWEECWGIGSFSAVCGVYYVLTGTVTFQVLLLAACYGMFSFFGIMWWRYASGDYNRISIPKRLRRLPQVIVYYVMTAVLLGVVFGVV